MLNALRELGEFALSICFDLFELLGMLQLPVIASSVLGAEKVRALQLSALVTIVTLIVWAGTSHSNDADWTTVGVVSTLYLSFSAWVVYRYLSATAQYEGKSDVKLDALSIVLTFNLVVIFLATILREINFYLQLEQPAGITPLDEAHLRVVVMVAPVFVAGCLLLINSLRYRRRGTTNSGLKKGYVYVGVFTLLNIALSDIYVYLIFVKTLQS